MHSTFKLVLIWQIPGSNSMLFHFSVNFYFLKCLSVLKQLKTWTEIMLEHQAYEEAVFARSLAASPTWPGCQVSHLMRSHFQSALTLRES